MLRRCVTFVLLSIALAACAQVPARSHLEAVAQDERCALRSDGQLLAVLDIPWPCELHRTAQGDVRVVTVQQAPVVLLQHSVPDPQLGCLTQLQALRQVHGRWEKSLVNSNASCPAGQWDEKLYSDLFER